MPVFQSIYDLSLMLGYLLGSVPYAFFVSKMFGVSDIRQHGSGNMGATNVLRVLGVCSAALTFLLDLCKPLAAIGILHLMISSGALAFASDETMAVAVAILGLGAVLGHVFPVWFFFEGGRGVVVTLGVFAYIEPVAFAIGLVFLLCGVVVTGYVGLFNVLAVCGIVAYRLFAFGLDKVSFMMLMCAALVCLRHSGMFYDILCMRHMRGRIDVIDKLKNMCKRGKINIAAVAAANVDDAAVDAPVAAAAANVDAAAVDAPVAAAAAPVAAAAAAAVAAAVAVAAANVDAAAPASIHTVKSKEPNKSKKQ